MGLALILTASVEVRYVSPLDSIELAAVFSLMGKALELNNVRIELDMVDDASMAEINYENMQCAGPTNILSFPMLYDSLSPYSTQDGAQPASYSKMPLISTIGCSSLESPLLGTLVFSPETARREAFLYGQPLLEYTIFLLAHGLAHILGYEHGIAMDALVERLSTAARQYFSCEIKQ